MPPLPNTFDQETRELIASAQRRQKDLGEFQIPRLAQCKGPLAVQQNLAAELREDVDTFARLVDSLDVLVGDQKGEKNRRELRQITDEFKKSLARLRKDARNALLNSKKAIDSRSKSNRDELFQSSVLNEKQEKTQYSDDTLMKANDDVTETLRRTVSLMQGELEKSVLSTQMFDASSASLRATSSTHDTLTNVLDTSKMLITALEKSDWLDRVLILAALLFFFLVVLFILKQRILDRSMRIAFWWTRFIPDFSGDSALLKMEEGRQVVATTSSLGSTIAGTVLTSVVTAIASQAPSVTSMSTSFDPIGSAPSVSIPDDASTSGAIASQVIPDNTSTMSTSLETKTSSLDTADNIQTSRDEL